VSGTDPEELIQRLEREIERLQVESGRLGDEASDARKDWERKRSDPSVPGAPPAEDTESGTDETGGG
jgi:hypothetical protein